MNRRDWMKITGITGFDLLLTIYLNLGKRKMNKYRSLADAIFDFTKADFNPTCS